MFVVVLALVEITLSDEDEEEEQYNETTTEEDELTDYPSSWQKKNLQIALPLDNTDNPKPSFFVLFLLCLFFLLLFVFNKDVVAHMKKGGSTI